MSQAKTEEKKKDKKLILIILLLLFIIIGLIFFIFFMKKNDGGDDKAIDRNVLVDEDNAEDVVEKLLNEERVPLGRYQVTMSTTWTFENGKSTSEDAYVANVDRNTNAVYFDLVRSDTEEVILASPIIPLGKKLDNITLDTDLPKGTYDCVCTYHLVDDDMQPISKVNVGVTVNVKS
ncbi:MAG: hypothetical protein J5864_03295 [Oscillospiraceae bacterium]|nr:hypothetical protein [Oscillospiraceae bacterium]